VSDFVKLRATISGDRPSLAELRARHFAGKGFDYNTVIPMPAELAVDGGSTLETGHAALFGDWRSVAKQWMLKEPAAKLGFVWPLESREEVLASLQSLDCAELYLAPARAFQANIEKYGHGGWFSWCKEQWGSPWNANEAPIATAEHGGKLYVRATLPSYPSKIFSQLSKTWETLSFLVQYVNEHERRGRSFVLRQGREVETHKMAAAEIAKAVHSHPLGEEWFPQQ
jgi:hypothetical protein